MTEPVEQLIETLNLLAEEYQEDLRQYREKVLETPLDKRISRGSTIYPAWYHSHRYGTGGMLLLNIDIPEGADASQFQNGQVVAFFTLGHTGDQHQHEHGVVVRQQDRKLQVALSSDDLPEWADEGKVGIDLYFDETSYREMQNALNQVIRAENRERLAHLRNILLGQISPGTGQPQHYNNAKLNESQNRAVSLSLEAEDAAVIHGPPGTGKTTTLIAAIQAAVKVHKQVLVCAPSNVAVDVITERLVAGGVRALRLGHPARVSEELQKHTLDQQMADHQDYKLVKELHYRGEEMRKLALKYKRSFGHSERKQRQRLLRESRSLMKDARLQEQMLLHTVIHMAEAIVCTLVGASSNVLGNRKFPVVFIDEAAQALEPACWIPILRSHKVIFAGDHYQLPPTVKSRKAEKEGLGITLMEKFISHHPEASVMLSTQYRMNEKIAAFSSDIFYKGELLADESVANHKLESLKPEFSEDPVIFIDTAGCGFEEKYNPESRSLANEGEAKLLTDYLLQMTENAPADFSIGIIAPYREQVHLLKKKISAMEELSGRKGLSIHTVDGFQGQEKDMILISLVRSNDRSEIGFLNDIRRMNVALTRAKKKLVVTGDSATLSHADFYRDFINYVERIGGYRSAWEIGVEM